jgi:hypothetical protein
LSIFGAIFQYNSSGHGSYRFIVNFITDIIDDFDSPLMMGLLTAYCIQAITAMK